MEIGNRKEKGAGRMEEGGRGGRGGQVGLAELQLQAAGGGKNGSPRRAQTRTDAAARYPSARRQTDTPAASGELAWRKQADRTGQDGMGRDGTGADWTGLD